MGLRATEEAGGATALQPGDRPSDFRALVGAQLLGAFNDNLFKQLLLLMAALTLFPGEDKQGIAFAVFALPFIIFSGMAGDLSERFSKRSIIWRMKLAEIVVMALGLWALQVQSWNLLLAVLFLMGLQSAFFGPAKYGVIPELVGPSKLVGANGTIAMTTFMGVLFGQALAGPLLDNFNDQLWLVGAFCVGFAVLGTVFARFMKPLAAQKPDLEIGVNPFGNLFQTIGVLRSQKGLFSIVLLYSFFWFNGGVIQQAITGLGDTGYLDIQAGEATEISYLLVFLAVSIMVGSLVAPKIASRFPLGKVAATGAVMMVLAQLSLLLIGTVVSREQGALHLAKLSMVGIGFFGAFFVVPIQSYLQDAPPAGMRGQTFAVNNFMNFIFIFLGGVWYMLFRGNFIADFKVSAAITQVGAGLLLLGFLAVKWRHVKVMEIGGKAEADPDH
jgi:MFS family permease